MTVESPLPSHQLNELARRIATTLQERSLVGPIQPLAVPYDIAGAMLGVSGRSVRNWADAGLLTRCQLGQEGATPRILVSSIHTYLAATAKAESEVANVSL